MGIEREGWLKFSCLVADADLDIARKCPRSDRMTIGADAVNLMLVGIIAVVVWYLFLASFLPWTAALPGGLLVGSVIFLMDRRIASSDWTLTGVLSARKSLPIGWYFKLLFRIGSATCFAFVTAIGLLLAIYSDTLSALLRTEQSTLNSVLQTEYDARKEDVRVTLVEPRKQELDRLVQESAYLREQLKVQDELRSDAARQSAESQIEMGREREGGLPGYVKGEGPRYKDAATHLKVAQDALDAASSERDRIAQRLADLAPLITTAGNQLGEASARALIEQDRIEEDMKADSRWQSLQNGPLSRWMALQQLREDPKHRAAVRQFDLAAKITLIGLELSFLFVKVFFASASQYHMKISRRTRQDAAQEISEYREALRAFRTPRNPQRPVVRLVTSSVPPPS